MSEKKQTLLIDGAFGQDGKIIISDAYLRSKVDVHIITHRNELLNFHPESDFSGIGVSYWDGLSYESLCRIIEEVRPKFYLNLAADHQSASDMTVSATKTNIYGRNYSRSAMIVSALSRITPDCHYHYASSSLIYSPVHCGQKAFFSTMPTPTLPYGLAKANLMKLISLYRHTYGLKAAVSIMFNHDSKLKKDIFLIQKIAKYVAVVKMKKKIQGKLHINNIGATYDLSSAYRVVKDIIYISFSRLEGSYILASGVPTSVREVLDWAFSYGSLQWRDFVAYDRDELTPYMLGVPSFPRPTCDLDKEEQRKIVEEIVAHQFALHG